MFSKNLSKLMNDRGVSAYRLSKDTGVAQSAISEYRSGKTMPGLDKLQVLADYFGITVDALIGQDPPTASAAFSDEEIEIIRAFRTLSPATQDALLALVRTWEG